MLTGMRVRDGMLLCRELIVLPPDANKYRDVHLGLKRVLGSYTDRITPKSIDEFVLDLEGSPAYKVGMWNIGKEMKARIKSEVGDYLTVSVGIAPNRFLAKTAAGLHKPDGLDEINLANFESVYKSLALTDLCGVKLNNATRLNNMGIFSVWDFYNASTTTLHAAFQSINGYYWHSRLNGFEIDDVVFGRKSYGNSYALPKQQSDPEQLAPIMQKLVEKMGMRLRKAKYRARGVHVALLYADGTYWHRGETQQMLIFDSRDIYKIALHLMCRSPYRKPVHTLAVSCFDIEQANHVQLTLLDDLEKKENLVEAVDKINERWGKYVITPARMLGTQDNVPDRIAFGGIKELEEIVLGR
jgi:DNA polymerase-4